MSAERVRSADWLCEQMLALAESWDRSLDWATATALEQSVGLAIRSLVEEFRLGRQSTADDLDKWRKAVENATCRCPTAECCAALGH